MNIPARPRSTLLAMLVLWVAFYAGFTLFTPPLLDDADSVHAEVAREMLQRHDYVTLYANGIRYLEKAPLMYWSMAASMKIAMLFSAKSPRALAAAARFPIALDVLGLVWLAEVFARCMLRSARAGLYAALILLSSFGIFLFTRLTLPDAGVCLWLTLALYAFWRTEEIGSPPELSSRPEAEGRSGETRSYHHRDNHLRLYCGLFAVACALNVLTKGLIGVVFPVAIVLIYLLLTRGFKNTLHRLRELHPLATLEAFILIAAPWHILAGLANPTQGHPAAIQFIQGHWLIPNPTDGNVHGWFWFYFMNEHVLRYLNLRIPHDYDTSPLWLFWGLCFLWIMPWSAFLFKALRSLLVQLQNNVRSRKSRSTAAFWSNYSEQRGRLLLLVWGVLILLFFSLSTRQEYYVLPALPAFAIIISDWLAIPSELYPEDELARREIKANLRITTVLLILGTLIAACSAFLLIHAGTVAPNTDLATLLNQNPSDYALSMGHFLDLTGPSIALFRLPLSIAALSLFLGPLAALIFRKRSQPHRANLALAATAFGFLIAVFLGLRIFSPVLTSAQLAESIAPQVHPDSLIVIHGEYESASTLGFYLQRPGASSAPSSENQAIHILDGRSSNLWYGSFFLDAPDIFETPQSLAEKWNKPQRIFLWQSLTDPPSQLPTLPGPVYILVISGGKEILSNQPNR